LKKMILREDTSYLRKKKKGKKHYDDDGDEGCFFALTVGFPIPPS